MKLPAREQIVAAARANGWETRPGYLDDAEKNAGWAAKRGKRTVNVEFSVRGGITWSCLSDHVLYAGNRLARVLAYLECNPDSCPGQNPDDDAPCIGVSGHLGTHRDKHGRVWTGGPS